MAKNSFSKTNTSEEVNISMTAYRALLVLGFLIESPHTKSEILQILKNDKITSRACSEDTLRVTLNTLKAAGCIISRPTQKNNFNYSLTFHPFGLFFSKEQINCLNTLRRNLTNIEDWQYILDLNNLFNKIALKSHDNTTIEAFKDNEPLSEVNKSILETLNNHSVLGKNVLIEYNSVRNGLEDLYIIPKKVFYENLKLYVECYCEKYQKFAYLRLDKIKQIKGIGIKPGAYVQKSYLAKYTIKGDSVLTFEKKTK
ncbi:MAG: WYL domain-containing protein [Candidatus Gastranaerophilales bacterium]|nr:WYL domain-containing protein [Candidatus Gastranaerophilales bacterium]